MSPCSRHSACTIDSCLTLYCRSADRFQNILLKELLLIVAKFESKEKNKKEQDIAKKDWDYYGGGGVGSGEEQQPSSLEEGLNSHLLLKSTAPSNIKN